MVVPNDLQGRFEPLLQNVAIGLTRRCSDRVLVDLGPPILWNLPFHLFHRFARPLNAGVRHLRNEHSI
jgi:hypothetical protein